MKDFNLKLLLAFLSGTIFAFIFIILALTLPFKEKKEPKIIFKKPTNRLEKISKSFKE